MEIENERIISLAMKSEYIFLKHWSKTEMCMIRTKRKRLLNLRVITLYYDSIQFDMEIEMIHISFRETRDFYLE